MLRRAIEFERRWGGPVNAFAVVLYEWLFVVIGPAAVIFGAFNIAWGFWAPGTVLILLGVWMTWSGWRRLHRFFARRS